MAEAIEPTREVTLDPRGKIDEKLTRLRRLTSERDRIELVGENRVARIKAGIKERTHPLNVEIDELIEELDGLAQLHKDEVTGGTQTAEFTAATLEWRSDNTGSLVIDDEAAAIAMLKTLPGGAEAIEVKESVRKDTLKRKPDLIAKLMGVRIEYAGSFAIKVKPTRFHERSKRKPFKWSRRTS